MKNASFARCAISCLSWLLVAAILCPISAQAEQVFRIGIMQAQKDAARKYRPLEVYLKGQNIPVQFVATRNYPEGAELFAKGEIDGMFSGSGVAGSMIIKGLADPLVRPVTREGHSTYWAVVLAPQGAPPFTGKADYFAGKKVLATPLASSGEFYFRSLPGIEKVGATLLPTANHGAAIDALSHGAADIAIVKNWTWAAMKGKYPGLQAVGKDDGDNPDMTLIVGKKSDPGLVAKVKRALLVLQEDQSPEAQSVRDEMKITKFIPTTKKDFAHNLALLKRAGVDASFNFEFK